MEPVDVSEQEELFTVVRGKRLSLVGTYDLQAVVYGGGTVVWMLTETTWPDGTKTKRMLDRGTARVPSIDSREVTVPDMLDHVIGEIHMP